MLGRVAARLDEAPGGDLNDVLDDGLGLLGRDLDRVLGSPRSGVGGRMGRALDTAFGVLPLLLGFFFLASQRLGPLALFALLTSGRPLLLGLVLLDLVRLRERALHLADDMLELILVQRLLHGRQQLTLVVAGMLPERLLQVRYLAQERLLVLRKGLQLAQLGPQLLVLPNGGGDEIFGLRLLAQDREQVLLLQFDVLLEPGLQLREQPLASLHRVVRGLRETRKQVIGLGGSSLHQCL